MISIEIISDFDHSGLWRSLGLLLGSFLGTVHGCKSKNGLVMAVLRDLGGEILPKNH